MTRTQPNPDWPTQPPFPTGPGPQLMTGPQQPWPDGDSMPTPQPRPTPYRMSAHKQASPSAPTGAVLAVHSGRVLRGALAGLPSGMPPAT